MARASPLTRIIECDVCFVLLEYCDLTAVASLSRVQCLRRRLATHWVWQRLCVRDYPRVRWPILWQVCRAHPQRVYKICARRDHYDHCILCDHKMWRGAVDERHLLLLCPCLGLPQYIVVHEGCCAQRESTSRTVNSAARATATAIANRLITPRAPQSLSRTLPNSNTIAQRRVRRYTCHFCKRLRNAIPIMLYSI